MKTEKKYKTPEYTRRAIDKYNSKFARFTISTPREVKDRLNAVLKAGESANALINDLLLQEIERREAAEAADTDLQEMNPSPAADHQQTKPQEAPQDAPPGARTNSHEATKSATEGRTEAQEATTSAATAEGSSQEEPKPRGRSSNRGQREKASGANKSPQETTGGPEEGTTAGSSEDAQPVEAADAPQPINPGDNLQDMLLYPYGTHDDIPPEELPFH